MGAQENKVNIDELDLGLNDKKVNDKSEPTTIDNYVKVSYEITPSAKNYTDVIRMLYKLHCIIGATLDALRDFRGSVPNGCCDMDIAVTDLIKSLYVAIDNVDNCLKPKPLNCIVVNNELYHKVSDDDICYYHRDEYKGVK